MVTFLCLNVGFSKAVIAKSLKSYTEISYEPSLNTTGSLACKQSILHTTDRCREIRRQRAHLLNGPISFK